ncbi:LpqN/LpqT family lipoprotein [Nocardia sp. NBC_00511]|uniref:LpqN/LpqT family lipoprotein n=1 Tax=Nocardia sp. NBC_00511 TaxID=2903591 RepID=UPI0030E11228
MTATIAEFLTAAKVDAGAVDPAAVGAPKITVGVPEGWQQVPAGTFPGTYAVWTQAPVNGWADNAVVVVVQLAQRVDAGELLAHAYGDARLLPQWTDAETDTSSVDGFPSAAITGTYLVDKLTLWAYNRYIVLESEAGQFLAQLTITTRNESDGSDAATILEGLSVSV